MRNRLCSLVFRSGVSTSPVVTDISGRGLGLAIVQEKAERLGGVVSCESSAGRGRSSVSSCRDPATVRGLLVRIEEQLFVIPAAYVRRTFRASFDEVRPVEGSETVSFEGSAVPLIHLAGVLELSRSGKGQGTPGFLYAVVLESEDKLVAFRSMRCSTSRSSCQGPGQATQARAEPYWRPRLGAGRVVAVLNVPIS